MEARFRRGSAGTAPGTVESGVSSGFFMGKKEVFPWRFPSATSGVSLDPYSCDLFYGVIWMIWTVYLRKIAAY